MNMRKPAGPKRRQKFNLTDDVPVEEFTKAWFEIFSERPDLANGAKERADEEGISVEALMCKLVAEGYHAREMPLPPKLREFVEKQSDMPDSMRRQLLRQDLN